MPETTRDKVVVLDDPDAGLFEHTVDYGHGKGAHPLYWSVLCLQDGEWKAYRAWSYTSANDAMEAWRESEARAVKDASLAPALTCLAAIGPDRATRPGPITVGDISVGCFQYRDRIGIISKVGRKRAELTYTTAGDVAEARKYGHKHPKITRRSIPLADLRRVVD